MNPVEKLLREREQQERARPPEFELEVKKLSEAGVRLMLTKLLGLDESAIDSWSAIGPLIEAHRITLDFNLANREWEATLQGDVDVWGVPGKNPRLAVGRLLIVRQIEIDPNNSYAISVPYRVAVEFGHEHQPDDDGVVPSPEDKVVLKLLT